MKKFYCDRCGEEIKGKRLKMFSSDDKTSEMYIRRKLVGLMTPLADMDFCEECLTEIVDFALNKKTCDECVQQMMDESAVLRELYEETGPSTQVEPDPDGLDWNTALNRMEQLNHSDGNPS